MFFSCSYLVTEALFDLSIVVLNKKQAKKFPFELFKILTYCLVTISKEKSPQENMYGKLKKVLAGKRERLFSSLDKFGSVHWHYKDITEISCFLRVRPKYLQQIPQKLRIFSQYHFFLFVFDIANSIFSIPALIFWML